MKKKLSWFWDCVCCSFYEWPEPWEKRRGNLFLGAIFTDRYQDPDETGVNIETLNTLLIDKVVFGSPYNPLVWLLPFLVGISGALQISSEVCVHEFIDKLEDLLDGIAPWDLRIFTDRLFKDAIEEVDEEDIVNEVLFDTYDLPGVEDRVREATFAILDDVFLDKNLRLCYRPSPTKNPIVRYLRRCAFDPQYFLEHLAGVMMRLIKDDLADMGSALYGRYVKPIPPGYCPKCEMIVTSETGYCPECGAELEPCEL